jgi:hypothetical protein
VSKTLPCFFALTHALHRQDRVGVSPNVHLAEVV